MSDEKEDSGRSNREEVAENVRSSDQEVAENVTPTEEEQGAEGIVHQRVTENAVPSVRGILGPDDPENIENIDQAVKNEEVIDHLVHSVKQDVTGSIVHSEHVLWTDDVNIHQSITFRTMFVSNQICDGLEKCRFTKPSAIQLKAIPLARSGFDLILRAKSGTGKTLVFAIIALEIVNVAKDEVQVLIVAPTKRIVVRMEAVLKKISQCIDGLRTASIIGGLSIQHDVDNLFGCHIAIGTPERLRQLITSKMLDVHGITLVVLYEADQLIDSDLQSDVHEIYCSLPDKKQVIASSATYPNKLEQFLTEYMNKATIVTPAAINTVRLGVKQYVKVFGPYFTTYDEMKLKFSHLCEILSKVSYTKCVIFSKYRSRVESLSKMLTLERCPCRHVSSLLSPEKRLDIVADFRDCKFKILLSTDVVAIGCDCPNVDLVINFDVPEVYATYLHRMGCAGRYGSQEICISLVSIGKEENDLRTILNNIGGEQFAIMHLPAILPRDLWNCNEDGMEKFPAVLTDYPSRVNTESPMFQLTANVQTQISERVVTYRDVETQTNHSIFSMEGGDLSTNRESESLSSGTEPEGQYSRPPDEELALDLAFAESPLSSSEDEDPFSGSRTDLTFSPPEPEASCGLKGGLEDTATDLRFIDDSSTGTESESQSSSTVSEQLSTIVESKDHSSEDGALSTDTRFVVYVSGEEVVGSVSAEEIGGNIRGEVPEIVSVEEDDAPDPCAPSHIAQ